MYLVRSRDGWMELGMMLDASAGYGVRGLRFDESEGPGAVQEARMGSDAEAAAAADALLAEACGVGRILRGRPDGEGWDNRSSTRRYGLADRGLGAPNRPDTKFNLGSINKIFTQTAIAQLAEKGKLSFTDTIRKHLPEYPLAAADRITIQQLVSMTSGLGDFFGEKFNATPKARIRTLEDYFRSLRDGPAALRAGNQPPVLQRRLHRARAHHRKGVGAELLRLRPREHLRARPA